MPHTKFNIWIHLHWLQHIHRKPDISESCTEAKTLNPASLCGSVPFCLKPKGPRLQTLKSFLERREAELEVLPLREESECWTSTKWSNFSWEFQTNRWPRPSYASNCSGMRGLTLSKLDGSATRDFWKTGFIWSFCRTPKLPSCLRKPPPLPLSPDLCDAINKTMQVSLKMQNLCPCPSLSRARSFARVNYLGFQSHKWNSPTKLAPSFRQCNLAASRPKFGICTHTGAATSAVRLSILTRLSIRLLISYQPVISFRPGYQSGHW